MKRVTLLILAIIATQYLSAQVAGLWEVKEVTTGAETTTPVARWFQFSPDNTMQSGNGGIEHSRGTYIITPDHSVLIFTDQFGKTDAYGAFTVTLNENTMSWSRVEEGQPVKVSLQRITTKPEGPWDQAIGSWKLVESTEHDEIADQQIQICWDREYRAENGLLDDNTRGVWYIAARQQGLKLMSFNPDQPDLDFAISFFNDYRMIWTNEEDSLKLVFDRNLE